jgi:ABC-type nitrate/sulfonate/bicarbonate transport system substrate-binding protein
MAAPNRIRIAQFKDATEFVWLVSDYLFSLGLGPAPPQRQFVGDADEAHRLALSGAVPVVGMSFDDVLTCSLADHENAGQVTSFYGVHRGFLSLCAETGLTDLRGKTIAVDTYTGYASALFEMLARRGLDFERDVHVVLAGATNLRYEKLLARDFSATLLGSPFDLLAAEQGFRSLAGVLDCLGGYQAVVLSAHRSWLEANGTAATSLTRAFENARGWAARPENRSTLLSVLAQGLPTATNESTVAAVADRLFGTNSEFCPRGSLSSRDLAEVVRLYAKYRKADLGSFEAAQLVHPGFCELRP